MLEIKIVLKPTTYFKQNLSPYTESIKILTYDKILYPMRYWNTNISFIFRQVSKKPYSNISSKSKLIGASKGHS